MRPFLRLVIAVGKTGKLSSEEATSGGGSAGRADSGVELADFSHEVHRKARHEGREKEGLLRAKNGKSTVYSIKNADERKENKKNRAVRKVCYQKVLWRKHRQQKKEEQIDARRHRVENAGERAQTA